MKGSIIKRLGVVICMLAAPFLLKADHITGGDLTVRHVEGNTFEATLNLFRDCNSFGAPLDQVVELTVYDAVTNEIVLNEDGDQVYVVFNGFEQLFPELGNSCFSPDICLEIGVYQVQFELPDNPNGYYISKERCCRNDLSLNLGGDNLGFVFTADVPDPALENSTPEFGEYPLEAFFCVNGPNIIDFGASDVDGDSLVYSLVDPLNGQSSFFDPNPPVASAKPYNVVGWAAGFSADNQVGGTPPISIDPLTGVITAQPDLQGVFTLAVQVEEYRDGVLIGTIRRELQLTSTICAFDSPSVINTPGGETIFEFLVGVETCIPIEVTDPNEGDTLFLQATSELLDGTTLPQAIFPDADGFSTILQDFCWSPTCENLQDEPYEVTFTAFSRGCAPEVLVTELTIQIIPFVEVDFQTELVQPPGGQTIIDLYNPSTHCFDIVFDDFNDADSIAVIPSSDIFDFPNTDVLFPEIDQGSVELPFCWDVICDDVRPGEPYFIDFTVITTNCEVLDTTFWTVEIEVIVPPDVDSEFNLPPDTVRLEFYSEETFSIPVIFTDQNFFDTLTFNFITGEMFNLPSSPATFEETGDSLSILTNTILWTPECDQVRDEPYIINFEGQAESCRTLETTSWQTVVFLDLPPESAPIFELPQDGFSIDHSIGDDPIDFQVFATDEDPYDTLTLSFSGEYPERLDEIIGFEGILNGNQAVFADFQWIPDCPDVNGEPYIFRFEVNSRSCQKDVSRFFEVPISVTTPTMGIIEPIQNIFTPNGDGRNDVWTIENKEDPCLQNFQSVVYDRWGTEVFTSKDPAFEWNGDHTSGGDANSGQYFHVIEYFYKDTKLSYNGNVTLNR